MCLVAKFMSTETTETPMSYLLKPKHFYFYILYNMQLRQTKRGHFKSAVKTQVNPNVIGLQNLGNNCWLNSVIQSEVGCLFLSGIKSTSVTATGLS